VRSSRFGGGGAGHFPFSELGLPAAAWQFKDLSHNTAPDIPNNVHYKESRRFDIVMNAESNRRRLDLPICSFGVRPDFRDLPAV